MSPSTSRKINVGFVGLSATAPSGWASSTLAPAIVQPSLNGAYDIMAVSTTSRASAQLSAEKHSKEFGHPVKAYFGETSKIASDPDVDLVVASVKAQYHKQVVLPVIEAKKDFFIEWPAGSTSEETQEIAVAARKHGVRSIVGLQGRHSAVITKVKELLASGAIGTVRSTNVLAHKPKEIHFWAPFLEEENLYSVQQKNGASLLHIPIAHQLDTLTNVLGDFVELTATAATLYPVISVVDTGGNPTGKTYKSEISDHFSIAGRLKGGVLANIFWRSGYSFVKGRRQFIWEIEGDEGVIRMESNDLLGFLPGGSDPELYLKGEKVKIEGHGGPIESIGAALKEFADASHPATYATIDDAVKHKRLLGAIETSAKEGRRIVL